MKTLVYAVLLSLPLAAQVPTTFTLTANEVAADPVAGTIPLRATITNVADATLQTIAVRLYSAVPPHIAAIVVEDASWTCVTTEVLLCTYNSPLLGHATAVLDFHVRFPNKAGRAHINAFAEYQTLGGPYFAGGGNVLTTMWRRFPVTTAGDAGEGSLRAAIAAVNADPLCETLPCRIDFAIPAAAAGAWHRIQPETPLPTVVAGDVEIDATTQSDTNPLGPDVELIGTTLLQGNGIYIRSPRMAVRGLAIAGFPDNGILYFPTARGSRFTIEKNYIGVGATGSNALANGGRGVTIAEGIVRESFIRENVIAGNFRSGIFLVTLEEPSFPLSPVLRVTNNTIVNNGASGIFVGPRAQQVLIASNVIAGNAHFGIAVSRTASYALIGVNRISDHPLPAIDFGLDGPDDVRLIESATYDPATNTTTITGSGPPRTFVSYAYQLYANDSVDAAGYAEAEDFLGSVDADDAGRFTFRVQKDLRGKYVNALEKSIANLDGSLVSMTGRELSKAVRVTN